MATLAEALAAALDHHEAGRLVEAETLYRRILDAAPGLPDALHLLGVLQGQRGATDDAIALIEGAIAGNGHAADYHINLADLLRRAGRLTEAARRYGTALILAPRREDALASLALTAARLGSTAVNPAEAARWYRRALAIYPDYADVLLNLAAVTEEVDREASLHSLVRAARLHPDPATLAASAARLEQRNRRAEAIRNGRAALVLAPGHADWWHDQGRRLHADEDFAGAEAALDRAVTLAPVDSPARGRLGLICRTNGRPEAAARHYRVALDEDPGNAAIRTALWEVERSLGLHAGYHSHEGQDAFVHRHFFSDRSGPNQTDPNRTGGVFLDIGAYDGVAWSNTLFFERELGWSGLCVEASPTRFAALARNRPGRNLNIALADREGTAEFLDIIDGPAMMGGLSETFTPGQRAFVETLIHDKRLITVPVRRLDNVLAEHGITHVDYCSIDTEGAERKIVESIDFTRVTIDVFSLESAQEDPELRTFMAGLGYDFVCRFFGGDEIYARRGVPCATTAATTAFKTG